MTKCEQINELLSGYLDGELPPQGRQRVEIHLEECPACGQYYEEMKQLRLSIGQLNFGEMTPQERSVIMNDLPTRGARGFGWLLFILGLLVLCGFAAYEIVMDDSVSAIVKIGLGATFFGLGFLFLSVLRERLKARKTDKYKDVEI